MTLLVFDQDHPAYKARYGLTNIDVFLIDSRWKAFALQWLRIPYLVTPASHLHPSAVRQDLKTIHCYHSLVSMHAVYGDDAFDTYTHFFACGPYHANEVKEIKQARGLPEATVFNVGYPKLDELAATYASKSRPETKRKMIVLAPSWHATNLLKLHGKTLCRRVLDLGYDLIVRPHPHFFERDLDTMGVLRSIEASSDGRMKIENPHTDFESFFNSDLMISDWSGVAFEYAFATERPVVFIDAPRKVNSEELLKIDLPNFEEVLRASIGVIAHSIDELSECITTALSTSPEMWTRQISKVRDENIYNFMSAAESGARILRELADQADMLPPTDITRTRLRELINYYS